MLANMFVDAKLSSSTTHIILPPSQSSCALSVAQIASGQDAVNGFMHEHKLFLNLEIVNTILSLISVALYVVGTYIQPMTQDDDLFYHHGFVVSDQIRYFLEQTDLVINFFFLADWMFKLALASMFSCQPSTPPISHYSSVLFSPAQTGLFSSATDCLVLRCTLTRVMSDACC